MIGQCKVNPPTGIAGAIYTQWTTDADAGLAPGVTTSGSTLRKLLGAQVEAMAAQIDGASAPQKYQQDNAGGAGAWGGGGWANAPWAAWNQAVTEAGLYTLRVDVSCFMTVAADKVKFQVLVDAAAPAQPVNAPMFYFNTLAEHNRISWEFGVTLTAAAHAFQLQWDTVYGAGTLNTNGDDMMCLTLTR